MKSQVHKFLKYKIGLLFEELGCESGTEIPYSDANLDRCANLIEDYMCIDFEERNETQDYQTR